MYAVVRETTFDPEKRAQGGAQLQEFAQIRAQQPGYRGSLSVDAGDGRGFTITLWETSEQFEAARARLEPEAQRLMGPLWTAPSRVLGSGTVSYDDLTRG